MEKKAVVFDVRGKLANFKDFYTNSSALSHPFPPPTVVQGIIGAILGIDGEDLLYAIKDMEIAVVVLNTVKTIMMTINYIDTSETFWDVSKRTQIPM
jgi:CRISPR-associated protein Cas5h